MSRIQLALNVDDLETSIAFYSTLFGTEPHKVRPGYANFAVAQPPLKLVLIESSGKGGSINHLGVEVGSTAEVTAETARLAEAGLVAAVEEGTTCCYATQDKVWATGPGGERWEVYTVLADSESFGSSPKVEGSAEDGTCCAPTAEETPAAAVPACC